MLRPPRESSWIRRFSGLLMLVVLLQAVAERGGGDIPIQPSCNPPVQLENGFMEPIKLIYEKGDFIKYYCNNGFKLIGPLVHKCIADNETAWWNASSPQCQGIFCEQPPSISNGFFTENAIRYTYGTVVTYHCNNGFSLIGTPNVSCDFNENNNEFWNGNLPSCKVTVNFMETKETQLRAAESNHCENPVVKNGILLSGFEHTYTFGSTVTFECVIGYFMVGSYLIQCDESSLWNPEVPSCRKITPDLCGAPLIPNGIVQPLQHQYAVRTEVVVRCNPQQCFPDETIEISTVCQGYNLWEPPVLTCFSRTSSDTYKLHIRNGRIIGKKKMYFPGDNATIQCNAGYVLQGSTTIRYIGGKKWVPDIPSCSLSFFFVLLIIGNDIHCIAAASQNALRQVYVTVRAPKHWPIGGYSFNQIAVWIVVKGYTSSIHAVLLHGLCSEITDVISKMLETHMNLIPLLKICM